MTKLLKTILILIIIIILIIIALFIWPKLINNGDVDTEDGVFDIDTSEWVTYRNEEYGFEFRYPKYYENDEHHNLWVTDNIYLGLLNWGVNYGQQTVISITVYPLENKNEVINTYDIEIGPEEIDLNGVRIKKGKELTRSAYFFENDNFFYTIQSMFDGELGKRENEQKHNEYNQILSMFKFVE